jgi:hypothetical protein
MNLLFDLLSETCRTVEIHYHVTGTKRILFVGKRENIISLPFVPEELRTFILTAKKEVRAQFFASLYTVLYTIS